MQTITGVFPDTENGQPFCKVAGQVLEIVGPSKYVWRSPAEMTEIIQKDTLAAMARDSGQFLSTPPTNSWFGPHSCRLSGVPEENIPSYINSELWPRVKTNTGKRWKERHKTGEMIVTNCLRGSLRIDYVRGLENISMMNRGSGTDTTAKACGLWPVRDDFSVIIQGREFASFTIQRFYRNCVKRPSTDPRPPNWNPKSYEWELKSNFLVHSLDASIITEALAKANSGTVELLSTLAEMPETVKQALQGIREIIRMYKEARQKTLRLYNKAKGNSKSQTAYRNSKEFADAVVQIWMTWRFGIRPNVYLLEDCIDIIYSNARDYIRYKSFNQDDFVFPGIPGLESDNNISTIEKRCMIKRAFDVEMPEAKLMQLITGNVVIALYELTPLSWMLDYFVNLGDFFATLLNNTAALAEVSTFSWRVNDQSVSFGSNETGYIHVRAALYRREIINPSDAVCIFYNPDLSMAKYADIISVGWNIFKNDLPSKLPSFKTKSIRYTE